jgi:hypothetical protein
MPNSFAIGLFLLVIGSVALLIVWECRRSRRYAEVSKAYKRHLKGRVDPENAYVPSRPRRRAFDPGVRTQ